MHWKRATDGNQPRYLLHHSNRCYQMSCDAALCLLKEIVLNENMPVLNYIIIFNRIIFFYLTVKNPQVYPLKEYIYLFDFDAIYSVSVENL